MKNYFLIIIIALYFCACNSDDNSPPFKYFSKSYIEIFIDCSKMNDKKLRIQPDVGLKIDTENRIISYDVFSKFSEPYSINDDIWLFIEARSSLTMNKDNSLYWAVPQIGSSGFLLSSGDDPNDDFYLERQRGYDKYIAMIGDTTFNWPGATMSSITIVTPVSEIVITCDKDYTDNYPAGNNISNLFTVFFYDNYATIKNGYKPVNGSYRYEIKEDDGIYRSSNFPFSIISANLASIDFSSFPFISNTWQCHLDVPPDKSDSYTFYIKVIFTDGTVLEGKTSVNIRV